MKIVRVLKILKKVVCVVLLGQVHTLGFRRRDVGFRVLAESTLHLRKRHCLPQEVRMADVEFYYLSKPNSNFPSLTSPEKSRTEIAQTLASLNAEYLQLKQSAGKEARLVCDLSHNN